LLAALQGWFGGKKVYAEQTVITSQIQPILRNIDGYAYDTLGKLSGAKVTIKLQSNNMVVYTTVADDRGLYRE
jgi:hypothetical protein